MRKHRRSSVRLRENPTRTSTPEYSRQSDATAPRDRCPVVRLLSPPAHGKVTVKQGRLRATNMKQCLGMELPAFVAIYRSVPDFIGQDNFTLELIGVGGKAQIYRLP